MAGQNAIQQKDRPHLLGLVKAMVYANAETELEETFTILNEDPTAVRYPNFLAHCEKLYERRS